MFFLDFLLAMHMLTGFRLEYNLEMNWVEILESSVVLGADL